MRIDEARRGDALVHTHSLADPDVQLDLTADRWNLNDRQASVMIGRDVITPGVFGPDGGRRPTGVFIPSVDRPITEAFGMDFFGRKAVRFADIFTQPAYAQPTNSSFQKLQAPFAWPAEMVDGLLFVNEDERVRDTLGARRITAISTTDNENDTLNWAVGFPANQVGDKFHILYWRNYDKRGIWVTNGQKSWLLHEGQYVQYLDLGAALKGQRWDMARISRNLLMLVNDTYPARIIHLDEEASTEASTNSTLAGMITPIKPDDVEIPEVLTNNSWIMKAEGSSGSMTAGKCRIKVRAVNVDDSATSKFVQVYDEANPTSDVLIVVENDKVSIWNEPNDSDIAPPPLHERWTHIEVWRTTAGGVDYYREALIEIARLANERTVAPIEEISFSGATYYGQSTQYASGTILKVGAFAAYTHQPGDFALITAPPDGELFDQIDPPWNWRTGTYSIIRRVDADRILISQIGARESLRDPFVYVFGTVTSVVGEIIAGQVLLNIDSLVSEKYFECTLSDNDLAGFPVLAVEDFIAGGPPPICRRVASLGAVTVCMGKANVLTVNPGADSRNFYASDFTIGRPSNIIEKSNHFADYTFLQGDRFVVTADPSGSGVTLGEHRILSKTDDLLALAAPLGAESGGGGIEGHIRRAYEMDWPTIKSDEDIWFSRTDRFAPESFPTRTLAVSSIGDIFRAMVPVGNYVAVLMDSGVHLLFRSGTQLVKDTVAAVGQGTPWEDSVAVVANTVFWASSEGPKAMTVTSEVASSGMRAQIGPLGGTAVRQWFRDAYDADQRIDAGVDTLNHCVRWRRRLDETTYQVCQYSYRTGLWTLLDDDNGLAYAATTFAESAAQASPLLYSVTEVGTVFEVNNQSRVHPYDGFVVQAILGDDDVITHVAPSRVGRTRGETGVTRVETGSFASAMLGDVVRFRSPNPQVDGAVRVIVEASRAAIGFDSLPALAAGDEFIIGANRLRYRPAPLTGKFRSTAKTLDSLMVRALPGPRNDGVAWPDPPEGRFTLRAYREYDDEPVDERDRELEIFDENDVSRTTDDRVSALEGAGSALELELEMVETRTDFRLELIEAEVREETDQIIDASVEE